MKCYQCPVCGYGMADEPANYHICPSCGTEFGLHDQNASIEELREHWIRTGPKWWSKTDPKPENWNPFLQLAVVLKLAAPVIYVSSTTSTGSIQSVDISVSSADPDVEPKRDYFDWGSAWAHQKPEDKQRALELQ